MHRLDAFYVLMSETIFARQFYHDRVRMVCSVMNFKYISKTFFLGIIIIVFVIISGCIKPLSDTSLALYYTVSQDTNPGDAILAELPLEQNLRRLGLTNVWDSFTITVEGYLDSKWHKIISTPVYSAHSPVLNNLCTGWYAEKDVFSYRIILGDRKEPIVRTARAACGLFEPLYAQAARVDVSFLSTPVLTDVNGDGVCDIITGTSDDSRMLYFIQGLSSNRWLPARPIALSTEPPSMARPGLFTRLGSPHVYDVPHNYIGMKDWHGRDYIFQTMDLGLSIPKLKSIKWQPRMRNWGTNIMASLESDGHDLHLKFKDGTLSPLLFTNDIPFRSHSFVRPDWDVMNETTNQSTLVLGAHDGSFCKLTIKDVSVGNKVMTRITDNSLLRTDIGPLSAGSIVVPTVGDLNGDGLEDLLVGEEYGTVLVYFQDPSAETITFIKQQGRLKVDGKLLTLSGAGRQKNDEFWGYAQPLLVDMDGDGLLDLQFSRSDGCQYWSRNQGSREKYLFGTIKEIQVAGKPLQTGWRIRLALSDWDNDGKLDILGADNDGHIFWCLGLDKTGYFGQKRFMRSSENNEMFFCSHDGWGYGRDKFVVCDWNGDGVHDLLHARTLGRILVHYGVKNETDIIDPPEAIKIFGRTLWIGSGHTLSPTICDLDHDGREDWIIGTESGRVRYLSYAALHRGKFAKLTEIVRPDGYIHKPEEWVGSSYDCKPLDVQVSLLLPHKPLDCSGGGGSYELIWQLYKEPFRRWFDYADSVDVIGTQTRLTEFIAADGTGKVLIPGYHTYNNNAWLREWLPKHREEVKRWVDSGGIMIVSAGRDKTENIFWKLFTKLDPEDVVQSFSVEKSIMIGQNKFTIDSRDPTFVQHDFNLPDSFECKVLASSMRGNPVVVRISSGAGAFVFYTPELMHQDHVVGDGAYGLANPMLRKLWSQMMTIK